MITSSCDSHSRMELCRSVFDALLDSDALGFLLSSKHLHHFLRHVEINSSEALELRNQLIQDTSELHQFQSDMLRMYSCFHIEEVKHTSHSDLMGALDIKLRALGILQDALTSPCENSAQLDLAWRYRRSCTISASSVSTTTTKL